MFVCWPENALIKIGKRFTEKFSINHFPKHAWHPPPPHPLFTPLLSLCSLSLSPKLCRVLPEPPPAGLASHNPLPSRAWSPSLETSLPFVSLAQQPLPPPLSASVTLEKPLFLFWIFLLLFLVRTRVSGYFCFLSLFYLFLSISFVLNHGFGVFVFGYWWVCFSLTICARGIRICCFSSSFRTSSLCSWVWFLFIIIFFLMYDLGFFGFMIDFGYGCDFVCLGMD